MLTAVKERRDLPFTVLDVDLCPSIGNFVLFSHRDAAQL